MKKMSTIFGWSKSSINNRQFLLPREPFQLGFPGARPGESPESFAIYEHDRPPRPSVFRAGFGMIVRVQALLQIVRRAAVERIVGTAEDVGVVHDTDNIDILIVDLLPFPSTRAL